MKKKLEMLEQLQEIDNSIDGRKAEQAEQQSGISTLQATVAALHEVLVEQQEKMSDLRREKADREAALHAEQENIRRSEANMKEIRTNKEFQAVGREITAARKQVSEIEEQLLQLEAGIEELQAAIAAKKDELDAAEAAMASGVSEMQAVIAEIQTAVDAALASREALLKSLGSNLVRRYTQLREQRRGLALAIARDGSCMGCNMNLPPQLYNMLFKGEEIHFCPHCQRILFLKQEQPA